jgi:gluconate 2-dehydrogenase gamma chain
MDRRALLQRIAAAAGAAMWNGDTLAVELAKAGAARDQLPAAAVPVPPLDSAALATLAALSELIMPATDTPGALAAGVPAFVADMFVHWMNDAERSRFQAGLAALDSEASARFQQRFAACSGTQQTELFGALRTSTKDYRPAGGFGLAARLADVNAPFFHKARDLVTVGYFTSEVGINAELAYVPVPGRFEGDVPTSAWNRQMQL